MHVCIHTHMCTNTNTPTLPRLKPTQPAAAQRRSHRLAPFGPAQALLDFLYAETVARGCTVVYCTHILDGLDAWASDVLHVRGGAAGCD